MKTKAKRLRLGSRVMYTGPMMLGPSYGSTGTVGLVSGARGKSIHPDPSGVMTFVNWDDGHSEGVFTRMLQPDGDVE